MALTDLIGENNQSVVSGQKKQSDVQADRRRPQFLESVRIAQHVAPITAAFMAMRSTKEVGQDKFTHLEYDELPHVVEVDGALSSGATTINVTTGQGIRVRDGDILYNATTDEQIEITAVATDALTVTRGHGASTAGAIADNESLHIFAMSDSDGNTSPAGFSAEPKIKTNYLQIEKETVELSGRNIMSDNFGEPELRESRRAALRRLMTKVEKSLLFGSLDAGSSNSATTGGFKHFISTNTTDLSSGALTEATWNTHLRNLFRFNHGQSNSIMMWVGETLLEDIQGFKQDAIRYSSEDKMIDLSVGRYANMFGNVPIMPHGVLTQAVDDSGKWKGMSFGINMDNVKLVNFRGRGLRFFPNKQTPDQDGIKDYWMIDFGLWFASERQHSHIFGGADV